jgi:proteasome lid subunit RPN8/RPN11
MMLDTFNAFEAHAREEAPRECCGLIVRGPHGEETYRPCRNVNPELDQFTVHHEDWDAAEDAGKILAVCHSHPGGSALPGATDWAGIEQSGIPWYILGTTLQRIDPVTPPLAERSFTYGWSDCLALVRDWYLVNRGVRLPDFPREPLFWERGHNVFVDQFTAFGFQEVAEAEPGDLLLMAIGSKAIPNHVAVLLEGERIFDHQIGSLSGTRPLRPLAAHVTHRLRYSA